MNSGFICSASVLTATLTATLTESQEVRAKEEKAEISKSDVMLWHSFPSQTRFGSKHR